MTYAHSSQAFDLDLAFLWRSINTLFLKAFLLTTRDIRPTRGDIRVHGLHGHSADTERHHARQT